MISMEEDICSCQFSINQLKGFWVLLFQLGPQLWSIWLTSGSASLSVHFYPIKRTCFYQLLSWGTAIINGLVGHLLPVLKGEYIPGALQSAFMVPLGIYVLARVYGRDGLIYRSWIVRFVIPLGAGIIFHLVALIAPVKLSTEESEDYIVPIFQILGGILIPLLITYVTKKILNFKSQIYLLANS